MGLVACLRAASSEHQTQHEAQVYKGKRHGPVQWKSWFRLAILCLRRYPLPQIRTGGRSRFLLEGEVGDGRISVVSASFGGCAGAGPPSIHVYWDCQETQQDEDARMTGRIARENAGMKG